MCDSHVWAVSLGVSAYHWERQVVFDTFLCTSKRSVKKVVTHVTSRIEVNYRLCRLARH